MSRRARVNVKRDGEQLELGKDFARPPEGGLTVTAEDVILDASEGRETGDEDSEKK